jgi:hemerythrin
MMQCWPAPAVPTSSRESPRHKEDHEVLLDDLREIIDQVRSGAGYAEERLSADLQFWFSDHFSTHDARLHQHAHSEQRPTW